MIGTYIPKRETRDLWVAIAIALSLGVYHLLFNIISFLQYISYQYYQLVSNLLFFWILALLWVAYRRWHNAVDRQRKLRNILASIKPEVIMVVDPQRRIQMVNESVNIFGFSPEEVIKKTTDLLYLDRRVDKNHPTEIRDAIDKIGFHIGQATGLKRTGETFPLEIMTLSLKGSKGVVVVIRDITERKQTEESLRQSEERYRALVENANDVVFRTDNNGYFIFANASMIRITGYEEEEIIGKHYLTMIHPDMHEEVVKLFGRQFVKGIKNSYSEHRVIKKDGSEIWVGQNTQLIVENGKIIGFQAVSRDITERKRLEKELKESEEKYRELSIIDDLTKLYNSRHFYNQLKMEMDRLERHEYSLTLLLLDLDDFKIFNDTYGHIEGDQVLLRLGQVIKRCLRKEDSAYRYGGEEFTIILPITTKEEGAVTAERIREEFKKENFSPVPDKNVNLTVSIGLAQYNKQEDMRAFVNRVDHFMYQGKKNGKDRICFE